MHSVIRRIVNDILLFHGRTRTAYLCCCVSGVVERVDNSTGAVMHNQPTPVCRLTMPGVGDRGISVLIYRLECVSSFNTQLSGSRQWLNAVITVAIRLIRIRYDYTIRLRRIARAYFQFDASKK